MKLSSKAVVWGAIGGIVCFLLVSTLTAPRTPPPGARMRRTQPELELQTPDERPDAQPEQPKQPDTTQNPDEDLLQPEPPESKTPEKPAERSASHEQCSSLATEYKVRTVQDLANLPFEVQPTWARNRCAEELALPLVPPQNALPQELDTAECVSLKEKFGVVGRIIHGLPVSLRDTWLTSRCPQKIKELENAANGESPDAPQEPQEPSKVVDTDTTPETAAAAVEIAATNGFNPQYATRCKELMDKFKIRPGITWGNMQSEAMRNQWQAMRCDDWFWALAAAKSTIVSCPVSNRNSEELIAILVGSTSRGVADPSTSKMALFRWLLRSVPTTVDCGFRYMVVLGYDVGDAFYDTPKGFADTEKWFEDHVKAPLEKANVVITFVPVRFNNVQRKPGPVFLEMAKRAYKEGADYFYRLNDDTQLIDRWPRIFVDALKSLGPPYGVVGPLCHQGPQRILTHDFTHRTHMEIFNLNYYPPQLVDWWMDDWISLVYGSQRTFRVTAVEAVHHTSTHGQRYSVEKSHKQLLAGLVTSGRQTIREYMVNKQMSAEQIRAFDSDRKSGPPFKDFARPVESQTAPAA